MRFRLLFGVKYDRGICCNISNPSFGNFLIVIVDLDFFLYQLPIAKHTAEQIKQYCKDCITNEKQLFETFYFSCTPTQCWYFLKVTHALLIPAVVFYSQDETKQFQENMILAGGVTCFKNMLVNETFLANVDDNTKKAALLYVLKLNKLTMTTVCYAIYSFVVNALTTKQFSQVSDSLHNHAILLQNSTPSIPSGTNEITLKSLSFQFSELEI